MTRRMSLAATFAGPVLVVLAMSKVHAAWVADPPYDYTGSFRFAWSIAYIALLLVTTYGLGLPDLARSNGAALRMAAAASGASAVGISLVQLIVGDSLLPRFVVLSAALLLIPWHVGVSALVRRAHGRDADRDRIVLVASDAEAARLTDERRSVPEKPWRLERHLRPSEVSGHASGRQLVDTVMDGATVVVLDRTALLDEGVVAQAGAVHEFGIRVRTLQQFYEEWLAKLPLSELERSSLLFDIAEVHRVRYGRAKRLLDLAGGLLGLVPYLLVMPVVWLGNLAGSRGPLFYRQERVGRNGRRFTILKFRTMLPEDRSATTGSGGSPWTAEDDPRITPFGRFLRRSHLDELPQVWNVLRGDLSLVGPRPEQPRYVLQLSETLPFYGMRHLVRPGLTGWAQVKYGYAGDEDDALEKLQYEFFYLRHQSFVFDLKVLGRTIRSVLGSEGAGR